ncbi:MAG: hypothetical protein OEZ43_21040 [Gammaproteobacteria bacterium]|nr:hypothetical protein [Gammaproteobacteria bacterium]
MPITIDYFDETNPISTAKVNANFQKIADYINSVVGSQVIDFSPVPSGDGSGHVSKAGDTMLGQLVVPSLVIGSQPGLHKGDFAGIALLSGDTVVANVSAKIDEILVAAKP